MNIPLRFGFAASPVVAVLSLCGALVAGCHPSGAEKVASGHELYDSCKSCHKDNGLGDVTLSAPSIAGLPDWYVKTQLTNFRTGLRGAHPDDSEGLRMRPMSRQMANEKEIAVVTAYVAAMKPAKVPPTLHGDLEKGKATYALCGACHGPNGEGNLALKAPPLAGQADWYTVSQMRKFKSGIRGTAVGDMMGATMRPMAMTMPDEQTMMNVASYIATFPR